MKEVRLRSHLDGGEWVVILRQGWGKEEVCAVTCAPLLVTGSGGEATFFRAAFALLTVKFTFSLFIIIPPPPVLLH